jgi:hypothetical protein
VPDPETAEVASNNGGGNIEGSWNIFAMSLLSIFGNRTVAGFGAATEPNVKMPSDLFGGTDGDIGTVASSVELNVTERHNNGQQICWVGGQREHTRLDGGHTAPQHADITLGRGILAESVWSSGARRRRVRNGDDSIKRFRRIR